MTNGPRFSGKNIDISPLCEVLGVSKLGFYAWWNRAPSTRKIQTDTLVNVITKIHQESRGAYGAQ
jgi:putative transposase